MQLDDLIAAARDTLRVDRVYGTPIERDGRTIVPVAVVAGGGGGGGGEDESGQRGEGGGFGLSAKPAGVYVIDGDQVSWRPAVDVNRLVTAVAVVSVVALLTRVRVERLRRRRRR